MFGYVKVFEPELKVYEHEQYKAVYCALCRTLGKRYGLASRMTLSYDFTFLALFLMSMNQDAVTFSQGRCPFHPLKKRSFACSTPTLDYAADVAVLLTYHKLSDTISDETFWKRTGAFLTRLLYVRDYHLAARRCPAEAVAAKEFMQAQAAVEAEQKPLIDACAEPTAHFLSLLSSYGTEDEDIKEIAARFGYCLGRFIYFADAVDDLEEDLRQKRFNPYLASGGSSSVEEYRSMNELRAYAAESLHACVAVCAECYEDLPVRRYDGILRNIIYKGMPAMIGTLCKDSREELSHEESV